MPHTSDIKRILHDSHSNVSNPTRHRLRTQLGAGNSTANTTQTNNDTQVFAYFEFLYQLSCVNNSAGCHSLLGNLPSAAGGNITALGNANCTKPSAAVFETNCTEVSFPVALSTCGNQTDIRSTVQITGALNRLCQPPLQNECSGRSFDGESFGAGFAAGMGGMGLIIFLGTCGVAWLLRKERKIMRNFEREDDINLQQAIILSRYEARTKKTNRSEEKKEEKSYDDELYDSGHGLGMLGRH
jgi:hypothetical protein